MVYLRNFISLFFSMLPHPLFFKELVSIQIIVFLLISDVKLANDSKNSNPFIIGISMSNKISVGFLFAELDK